MSLIESLLAQQGEAREVAASARAQISASAALVLVAAAVVGMVAQSGAVPHVVHHPHHGLAKGADAVDGAQREGALVDPGKNHHIGFAHQGVRREVAAEAGGICFEEVFA